jgi:hypothetical protein
MNFFFNYIIKIDAHKIEHQLKNRHSFETIILKKQTKINNAVYFPTNPILYDKIKKLKEKKTKKNISYRWINSSNL